MGMTRDYEWQKLADSILPKAITRRTAEKLEAHSSATLLDSLNNTQMRP
jgi:hypothetical protein